MPAVDPAIPPEAKASDITVEGKRIFGPTGQFGTRKNGGMFNFGTTTIASFVEKNSGLFPNVSPSLLRIMRAVSENEGKLEAINSYDNAFMSIGIFQWTAGAAGDGGEIADVLDRLKTTRPAVFKTYFGAHGLDIKIGGPKPGSLRTGLLTLDGQTLNSAAKKEVLRTPLWGYRFWRAAHDNEVRACQIEQAIARIDVFYKVPRDALDGRSVADFVSSEFGVGLLLDQHVNRPGHVPKILVKAIAAVIAETGKKNPATWTNKEERAVLARYIIERATTNMTHSDKRAASIKAFVDAGALSDARGSFQ